LLSALKKLLKEFCTIDIVERKSSTIHSKPSAPQSRVNERFLQSPQRVLTQELSLCFSSIEGEEYADNDASYWWGVQTLPSI
jgi:hypothetical protein